MKRNLSCCNVFILFLCWWCVGSSMLLLSSPSDEVKSEYSTQDLCQSGPQRVFEGSSLKEIAFPLGGIGTGMVSLGGRGNLRDWEIFNRPGKGIDLPLTFFCLWVKAEGEEPLLRVLEGPLQPPFWEDYGHGYPRGAVPGLPRMQEAKFRGKYPIAWVDFKDSLIPIEVSLEAFNPFIPLEPQDSGIPGCVLRFRLTNSSQKRVKVTVVGTVMNPIGFDGTEKLDLRTVNRTLYRPYFGQNLNKFVEGSFSSGLFMSSKKIKPDNTVFGTMALSTSWKQITYLTHWIREEWFDDFFTFLNDLIDDGQFKNETESSPSPDGRTDMGSLGLMAELKPGESVDLPFFLTWHFPNFLNYFDRLNEMRGRIYKNNYVHRFDDAWDVSEYFAENLPRLEADTKLFVDVFFNQTLPPFVLEAVSSQVSIIRTPTCFWLDDGNFFGFEGCNVTAGCCPLNCTHVWNYAQSLAFLFPSLERTMRLTDFLNNVKPDGEMAFRTTLPLGSGKYWRDYPNPAADGQFGTIIRLYRDWQISGDDHFLKLLWPNTKKALEYAWKVWDQGKDGILTGRQHNTFDIEFYGVSSMTGSLYLGALLAGAEMAEAVGDHVSAQEYRRVFEKGVAKLDELTWNGEYYIQAYDRARADKYQYGTGCVSDQVLGQWLALVSGLDRFLPKDHVRSALDSIFKYNFRDSFHNDYHGMRTFALGDEQGLVNCSWPGGDAPKVPFVYAHEVWTGTEYQVASHLIYEGRIQEGLTIVKAIRDRHDGWKRNPWNEEESGNHYARAMSSWGVFLALTGFEYSGTEMKMGFDPKLYQEDFRCFWSCGSGWGSFSQKLDKGKDNKIELSVTYGDLKLKEFIFLLPPSLRGENITSLKGLFGDSPIKIDFIQEDDVIHVRWRKPFIINAGENLRLKAQF